MSSAGKAAIAVQSHVQVARGAWGAVRLVAGGREPRECGSCRVCSIHCVEVLATTPSRDMTHLRGISSRPRPICWFPAHPTHPVLGPAPRGQPVRRSTRFCLPPRPGRASRERLQRPENGPCFAFRPSDFPCAYAGSDGCPVFTRETSPVKWCGLYTGAAVRGRSVPLEEVHLAEIQA
jgi:hypothetical protein